MTPMEKAIYEMLQEYGPQIPAGIAKAFGTSLESIYPMISHLRTSGKIKTYQAVGRTDSKVYWASPTAKTKTHYRVPKA
jgi:DNA-binding Lrp family transcriptional regulator